MGLLPPLVAPGADLPGPRLARYSRQLMLPGFDEIAQRRLANARVLVIGAGGLGSASIPYLASAGVGTIGVVDDDTVELSNLHRQVAHGVADVGTGKAASIARTVAAIDPQVTVREHELHLDAAAMPGLVDDYDLLVDGSDNFATRYLSNDAAVLAHKPLVWGAILRFGGQVSVSWADAGPTYRDLYPVPPAPGEVPNCAEAGVIPGVCAVAGALMATEALKLITGIGDPLIGRVTSYDALTGRFREIEYARDPEAAEVTELIDYDAFCGIAPADEAGHGEAAPGDPNAEAPWEITVHELAHRLDHGDRMQLVDVREPYEAAIAQVPGSELIPLATLPASLEHIRDDVPVVVYCHLGMRSHQAVDYLRRAGLDNVSNLAGGIDAYASEIDAGLARY